MVSVVGGNEGGRYCRVQEEGRYWRVEEGGWYWGVEGGGWLILIFPPVFSILYILYLSFFSQGPLIIVSICM